MNTVIRTVAAVVTLALAGQAGASDATSHRLSWDCARQGAPGLDETKALFNVANNYQASQLRERLYARLRAECQRGPAQLVIVLAEPALNQDVRLAAVPTESAVVEGERVAQ
ncbi:MAG: hypothetical protein H6R27_1340 [Proteobacteria bacterium]|nr:hypothetical protein [Pseudomonadota bacterium]